jgi:antitoxin ParD1/3/4
MLNNSADSTIGRISGIRSSACQDYQKLINVGVEDSMPSSYAIGDHFEQFIKQQVQGGRYASASEVVRDALRLLEEQEAMREAALERLRADIREGLDSGVAETADTVLTRLDRKYAAMSRERQDQ